MGKINIILSDINEDWLRTKNRKHGDISKIINNALDHARIKDKPNNKSFKKIYDSTDKNDMKKTLNTGVY